jgi:hypothetical protein
MPTGRARGHARDSVPGHRGTPPQQETTVGTDGTSRGAGRRDRWSALLAGAGSLLLAACASTEGTGTLVQVNEFGATIQRVQADSDAANEKVGLVAGRFGALLHFDFEHDALAAFTEFHQAQEAALAALGKMREDVATMKGSAEPFFKHWQADLDRFSSTELKLRSQQRMTETRRRFDAIVASADSTQHAFEAFNAKMRDYSIFLAHDFNEESCAALRGDEARMKDETSALSQGFEKCSQSAREYVQTASLPTASSPAPAADDKTALRTARLRSGG